MKRKSIKALTIGLFTAGLIFIAAGSGMCAAEKPEIFVQLGHADKVNSVAYSPDGQYILSGSDDNTVKLWDVSSTRELRTLRGHMKGILAVGFAGDGKYALSIDRNDSVKIWEMPEGKNVKTYKIRSQSAAISQDGKYIVSGFSDKVTLWDALSGSPLKDFTGKKDGTADVTYAVALSSDGRTIASANNNDLLRVWNTITGKVQTEIKSRNVRYLVLSPRGDFLISYNLQDYALKLWDAATGRPIRSLYQYRQGNVPFAVFSPDGTHVLYSKCDYEKSSCPLQLEESATGKRLAVFEKDGIPVTSVAFSPNSSSFISGSWDRTVRLWNIATKREEKIFQGEVISSWSSSGYSSKTNQVLSGSTVWDISQGRIVWSSPYPEASLVISPDGKNVLVKSKKSLLNIVTGKRTVIFPEEEEHDGKTIFSPDGRYIAWDFEGKIKIWDVDGSREIMTLNAYAGSTDFMAFYPDNRRLVSVGPRTIDKKSDEAIDGTRWPSVMKFWDLRNGTVERSLKTNSLFKVIFVPDGKHFVGLEGSALSGMLRYYNTGDGSEVRNKFNVQVMGEGDYATDVTFSPDGRSVLTGHEDNLIRMWQIDSGKVARVFKGHAGRINHVSYTEDGSRIVSVGNDGTVRLWDSASGREIAQFISFRNGEWIVITPEGYYNASPGGAKHLNVRVGNNVYSIDNFYEKFFNPVYVASVLQGKKAEPVADVRKGILSPPDVRITSPAPGKEFSTDTLTVTVAAKDTGGGIDEIRLYHNGKAIGEDTRAVKIVSRGSEAIREYTVSLVDGANTFSAVGFSKDRTESNPYELIVKLTAPSKDVSLYVFVVGINKYKNPALNLNYAEPDARGIADFFKQQGKGLFKNVNVREIYNELATKENIVSKLNQLQNINPQDAVLIYLAGHGENISEKWYFIPHELTYPEREEEVKKKGISSDELSGYIKNIKAQKILMLIDACKSGAVLVAFRGFEDRKALSQLSRSTGVHIVAASTKDQFAAEVKELGHGVFTYTLLEGLGGKAAGAREAVTVRKLMGYVEEKLPEITKKYKQEAQYPVVDSRGMDFPLVIAK